MNFLWSVGFGVLLLSTASAGANELSDKVCPILKQVVLDTAGQPDYFVQLNLVVSVGSAYDFAPEPLKMVLADVDEATTLACPEDRTVILKRVGKDTLREAMR